MDDVRPLHASASSGETGGSGEEKIDGKKEADGVEQKESVEDYAKKVDYEILEETLTEDQLYDRCLTARAAGVGAVIVRPCDVDSALRFLSLGVIRVGSTVGHPFGSSATGVKVYECRDLLRRGVRLIHAYVNPGKMMSRQFQHQEVELIQLADSCLEAGAILKIVLDNPRLNDEMKIILCRMAKRVNAHFIHTTAPADLELVRKHCGFKVEVAVGGVHTLQQADQAYALGCSRIATTQPRPLLAAYSASLKAVGKAT
jgi:deoxyribose-phosphate aldolase